MTWRDGQPSRRTGPKSVPASRPVTSGRLRLSATARPRDEVTLPPAGAGRWVRWSVAHGDPWSLIAWTALAGLAVAAGMAGTGLPPVDLHGPLHRFGIMDPLCGGTRSVRLAAMGSWSESWRYNPVGVPLILGAAGMVVRAVVGWATGGGSSRPWCGLVAGGGSDGLCLRWD